MKKLLLFPVVCLLFSLGASAQNVGIGVPAPAYKLDVAGKINSTGDIYTAGYIGIGTTIPQYKLQINDGSIALFNSTDTKTWYFNYNSSGNYFQLSEGSFPRLVVANGGNVGIGYINPIYKLDVNGNANVETNLTVGTNAYIGGTASVTGNASFGGTASVTGNASIGGTATVGGNLTVNNGKGIVRSWNGAQIKYYTQESSVHAVMGAFANSIEGTIAWPSGIFTNPPQVLVGDITSIGGTVGTLFRVLLVPYDATNTNCHFRLVNTSNAAVDYNITWNIVLIGD